MHKINSALPQTDLWPARSSTGKGYFTHVYTCPHVHSRKEEIKKQMAKEKTFQMNLHWLS